MTDLSTHQGQAQHYAAIHARLMNGVPRLRPLPAPPPLPLIAAPPAPTPALLIARAPVACEPAEGIEAETPIDAPKPVVLLAEPAWKAIVAEVEVKHALSIIGNISRHRPFVRARQEAMYRLSHETTMSLAAIGRRLGYDHTTVLHSVRQHTQRLSEAGSLPALAKLPDLSAMAAWEAICVKEAWEHGLTLKDIVGPDRSLSARTARRKAIARMTDELGMLPERIGELLGRSKTTINQTLRMYRAQEQFEQPHQEAASGVFRNDRGWAELRAAGALEAAQ